MVLHKLPQVTGEVDMSRSRASRLDVPFLALPDMLYPRKAQAQATTLLVPSIACRLAKVFDRDLLANLE